MSSWFEVGLLVRVNPPHWEQTDLGEKSAVTKDITILSSINICIYIVIILVIWKIESYFFWVLVWVFF